MEQNGEKFDTWAIVELMGHHKIAGRVTEQVIAGAPLLRIDVPEVPVGPRRSDETLPGFTQFYGPSSIYSLTPTTEEIARKFAAFRREVPVSPYGLRGLPAVTSSVDGDDEL